MAGTFEEYDSIVKSASSMANPRLLGTLYTAADMNPDEEAGLHRLAKKTGLPVEALRVDKGAEARRLAAVQDRDDLGTTAPAAASWLTNSENASLAHDDVDNLSTAEKLLTSVGNLFKNDIPNLATSYGARIGAGYQRAYGGLLRYMTEGDPVVSFYGEEHDKKANEYWSGVAQKGADIAREGRDISKVVDQEKPLKSYGGKILGMAVDSIGAMAPGIAGGVLTMNPAVPLAAMGIQQFGDTYQESRAKGLSIDDSTTNAGIQGATETVTEILPFMALAKFFKPGKLTTKLAHYYLAEIPSEHIAAAVGNTTGKYFDDAESTPEDRKRKAIDYFFSAEHARDQVDTFFVSVVQGALLSSTAAGIHKVGGKREGKSGADDELGGLTTAAARTNAAGKMLNSLGEIVSSSKLQARLPEKFREFIAAAKAEGGVDNVYVSADAWATFWQDQGQSPEAKAVEVLGDNSGYREALAAGGDLVIPFEDYAARIAPTEFHQALVRDLRLHPGDMTQRELEEWSGKMPEEFSATLQGLDQDESTVPGDRKVHDEILGELLGAGRDRSTAEREALLWQSRYRSRAERLGKDAWDLYSENPIRIRRPMPEFMTRRDFVDTSIDPFLDRLRSGDVPTEGEAMGTSLVEFLREKGLKDDAGELASLGVDEGRKPFQKKLSREDGLPLDKAREAAAEAGYLSADSTIADFLDLIDKERRGAPVYADGMGNEGAANLRLDMEQLQQFLESHGVNLATMSNEEIRSAMKGISAGKSFNQGAPLPEKIEIDGVERSTTNSNGEPIARTEEGVRNFWSWFGDSKVVDAEGRPRVVYHGTDKKFTKINMKKGAQGLFWFTSDKESILSGDSGAQGTSVIMELYAKVEGPAYWKEYDDLLIDEFKGRGLDGAILPEKGGEFVGFVLSAGQLKAVANKGTFDPNDANILNQTYAEGKRGSITFGPGFRDIALLEKADLSTFIHESGHAWLEELRQDAAAPDAPDQVREDWEKVAAWAGIAPGVSTITVEAHEKFARAVEAYLMEGNAPSVELQPAFQRFKAWLLRIYREVRNLNVELTDEVRGVLDRLLATDEEIKRAEDLQGFTALFTDAAAAGMTDREFSAYRTEVERAHVEAETRLQQKLMAEITREQKAWWKEEREKVLGEVTAEAKEDPIYFAMQVLTNGKDFEGNPVEDGFKLSKDDLVRMYGKEFVKKLPRSFRYLYTKEGGVHPDAAAEILGFSSGDEMIRKMANTPPLKKFVEAETDVRMRQVYGDMLNDGTIADEALKALHSDYQGQVLRAELRALRRKEREVSPFVKAAKAEGRDAVQREKAEREYERRWMEAEKKLAIEIEKGAAAEELRQIREEIRTNKEAARRARLEMEAGIPPLDAFKAWAAQTIGAKPLRSILPGVYARAEQKAGKAAFEAASKGDFQKAGKEKQTQLLNHYLYLEAVQAKEDSENIYDYARRLEKPATQARIGKAGENYLEQINAILERYEFKKQTLETLGKRQSLLEWIQQQEELGLEPSIPEEMLDELRRKNYKELTIDELRAVRDALKNIEHLSREMNKIRIDNEEIELDLAIGELSASVAANFDPKRIPIDKETRSWLEKQGEKLSRLDASLIKAEQLVEWMDGGAIDGPWARMIFRPIAAAEAKENALTLSFTAKLADLVEAYGKEKRASLMEKVFIGSIGESITRQAAIAAALNTGNESNRTKLLEGYGWQEGTLDEILDHLDADDWTFVQLTWDTIEELWPEIAALEKRLTGLAPEKVVPREFSNAFGTWRGGYFPVVYDPLHSAAGEKQADSKGDRLFESTYVRATTEKGHTKARIEGAAYPILLSLEVIPSHMAQVIHDISHREAVVTANRLLNHKAMRAVLNSTIGAPYYRMLKQWLATVANDQNVDRTGNEFWTRFMGTLRTNATIVGMGFRMSTMLTQIVGFSQSLDIVQGKYLSAAVLRFTRHPGESVEWVHAKSGEMLNRRNSLDRDIRDGIRKMMGKHGAKQWVQAKAFAGIGLFDSIVSTPTWMGAYEQAKAEGLSEKDAVASGDRAVRLSQGAGGAKDLAAVQRSNDFMKLFTMFYSYFSVLYNRLRNMGRLKGIGELDWMDVAWKSFIMVMVPAIMGDLITGRGPDDDEDKALWALRKILAYPFMTIPLARDVANSMESGRPYSMTPVSRLFVMTAKLPSQVEAVAENRKDLSDLMFQFADLPGYAYGLPTGQARTTTKYLWDLMEGDVTAEDMGDVLKGLAFGHHKK